MTVSGFGFRVYPPICSDSPFFVFDRRRGGTSVCSSAGKQTLAPPGAPRAQTAALEGECPHEPPSAHSAEETLKRRRASRRLPLPVLRNET